MADHSTIVTWKRGDQEFINNAYSRGHLWSFDGGLDVPASASPHIVPLPNSVPENVDPEEAFVAAISSCHMLFFLSFASKKRYVVDSYTDNATGILEKGENGKDQMTRITLNPEITFSGERQPNHEQLGKLHHLAHEHCFLANSVKTDIVVEGF